MAKCVLLPLPHLQHGLRRRALMNCFPYLVSSMGLGEGSYESFSNSVLTSSEQNSPP